MTGETRDLDATGLFIAIGHDPRSELLTGQVDLDDNGYVIVEHPSTRHQPDRRLRRRRPGRPPLPPGRHRRRHRLRRRARRRALPRRAGARRRPRARPRPGPTPRWSSRKRRSRAPEPPHPARVPGTFPSGVRLTQSGLQARRPGSGSTHHRKVSHRGSDRVRDRRRVRRAGPQVRQARPGGLLGGVVRPVQAGPADPRRDRRPARRQDHLPEDERRREPRDAVVLPRHRHPDHQPVQGRRGREVDRRRPPQGRRCSTSWPTTSPDQIGP